MNVQPVEKGVFVNESPLQKLIELVKFDQKILVLEHSLNSLENEVAQHEQEISQIQHHLDVAKQHMRATRKIVDEKELRMKELDQMEKDAKKRLELVQGQREYESGMKQIKSIQKEQQDFEEQLLESWKQFEHAQAQYTDKLQFVNDKTKELNDLVSSQSIKIEELKKEIALQSKDRPVMELSIPEDLIAKYQVMRKRVKDPVVPLEHGSCSACFYHVLQQDLISIQRGALKQCHNCFRFLYYPK
ncbi:MAG: zinc ribbon domain-containing protein [Candidatus Babeliales bacterium]